MADSAGDQRASDLTGGNWPTAPFANVRAIGELNTGATEEDDPSLTDDELEIFFNHDGAELWAAKRASTTAAWGAPQPVSELNSQMAIDAPQIAPDGLTLFFISDSTGQHELYVVHRATRTALWGTAAKIEELDTAADEAGPFPTSDLLLLVFSSNRNGDFDLFQATRQSTSASWGAAQALTELNSPSDESGSWLSADRTVIYFESTRTGGKGQWDIWMATRPSAGGQFAAPVPVAELNSTAIDCDAWLSRDGRRIYFTSSRNGTRDIFSASR